MTDKPLSPTRDYYGTLEHYADWIIDRFFEGQIDRPMVTVNLGMKHPGRLIFKQWNHETGPCHPEFKINPIFIKHASREQTCLEFLRLTQLLVLAYAKPDRKKVNYHGREFARAMLLHGVQTHRLGDPDKETGEHVTLSVLPGMKFEKELGRKTTGLDFTWSIREPEPETGVAADSAEGQEPRSSSGKSVKYVCAVEGCKSTVRGRSGQALACMAHDQPERLTVKA